MKCSKCNKEKDEKAFAKPNGGHYKRCQSCREYDKQYCRNNREKKRRHNRDHYERNREQILADKREHNQLNRDYLRPSYVKSILCKRNHLTFDDIPDELVESKALEMQLSRIVKTISKNHDE